MSEAAKVIKRYVELQNSKGSPSFELFGDEVEWAEIHSCRSGGKDDLFAAMRGSRDFLDDIHYEVRSIIANGSDGVLEAEFSGTLKGDGSRISVPLVSIFGVRDGKIVKEIDYVIMASGN